MNSKQPKAQQNNILKVFILVTLLLTLYDFLSAEVIRDRVVAYVENTAITLSDLEMKYADTGKTTPDIKKEEVLHTMINRVLMVKEAKKLRLEASSEDALIKEYIDLKIRAFIRTRDEEVINFYHSHIGDFGGKEFDAVREEIESYLIESEVNQRLKAHIGELRKNACVKIQLNSEVQE